MKLYLHTRDHMCSKFHQFWMSETDTGTDGMIRGKTMRKSYLRAPAYFHQLCFRISYRPIFRGVMAASRTNFTNWRIPIRFPIAPCGEPRGQIEFLPHLAILATDFSMPAFRPRLHDDITVGILDITYVIAMCSIL